MIDFIISLSPIILIFILVVFIKTDILNLSIISFVYTSLLTYFYFKTGFKILFLSSIDGVITTLPILLVVYTGILLSQFLIEKGSLQRLTNIFAGSLKNNLQKSLIIGAGFGNFFEGAGVIAEPVVAPMLYSIGISPEASVTLSILGYSGLMHLALAGVIVTVLSAVTSIAPDILSLDLVNLSFPASILLFLSIPYIIGESKLIKRNFIVILCSAAIINIFALITVKYISFSVSAMIGGFAGIAFLFVVFKLKPVFTKENYKDIIPFLAIFIFLSSINLISYLKNICFNKLIFKVSVIPVHIIKIRPLYSAYIYLFICFLISFKLFADKNDRINVYLKKSFQKAYKPVISMALFGAIGSVIAFSGLMDDFSKIDSTHNIAFCIANGFINYTGRFYPIFAPVLGWMGTFLTGYGIASIMLFGKLQLSTASMLGISKSFLACSLTVGASVGSISSPFKIALAAPLCNAVGKETKILNKTIPLGIAVSLLIGIYTYLVT